MPGEPRYPLYADDVPAPPPSEPGSTRRNTAPVVVVVVGLLLMALAIPVGLWLLFSPPGGEPTVAVDRGSSEEPAPERAADPNTAEPQTDAEGDAAGEASRDASDDASEDASGGDPSGGGTAAAKPTEPAETTFTGPARPVTGAQASVPATAPGSTDVRGNRTTYDASNLFDGVRTTTWRMAGDGTGRTLTFELSGPRQITRVGLINGYAKNSEQGHNWYLGNRRVEEVEWRFDDGTTVRQRLGQSRDLQFTALPEPAVTESVRLTLLTVSAPGAGRSARDYTAISEVQLVGRAR